MKSKRKFYYVVVCEMKNKQKKAYFVACPEACNLWSYLKGYNGVDASIIRVYPFQTQKEATNEMVRLNGMFGWYHE